MSQIPQQICSLFWRKYNFEFSLMDKNHLIRCCVLSTSNAVQNIKFAIKHLELVFSYTLKIHSWLWFHLNEWWFQHKLVLMQIWWSFKMFSLSLFLLIYHLIQHKWYLRKPFPAETKRHTSSVCTSVFYVVKHDVHTHKHTSQWQMLYLRWRAPDDKMLASLFKTFLGEPAVYFCLSSIVAVLPSVSNNNVLVLRF